MERIEVTYSADADLMRAASKSWARKGSVLPAVLGGLLLGLALIAIPELVLGVTVTPGHIMAAVVGAVCILILWQITHWRHLRQITGATMDVAATSGPIEASFDARGMTFRTSVNEGWMDWKIVSDITPLPRGTGLRVGGTVVAIPDSAVAEQMTPKVFRDRLATWWEAGR